jgi:uracil-DNA glycosylase family 4
MTYIPRERSTCQFCPLTGHVKIPSEFNPDAKVLIITDCPSDTDEITGKPFSGSNGKILNWALARSGITRQGCNIVHVIACRPVDDDITGLEGQDAIVNCRPGLRLDMSKCINSNTKVVLLLGSTALKVLDNPGNLDKVRGSVFEQDFTFAGKSKKIIFIPTYHPSQIMAKHWKRSGGGDAEGAVLWLADFAKAYDIAEHGLTTLKEKFNIKPTLKEAKDFIQKCLDEKTIIAIDTETTGLGQNTAQIVVIGIAVNTEVALSIPLLDYDGASYWTATEWSELKPLLNKLFSTNKQIYQNCLFDVPILIRHGFNIPYKNILDDTLMVHHCISPESKHDLGTIVSLYGRTPYWKAEFINRTTTILKMDQLAMRTYNLRDCVVLHQVMKTMWSELKRLNLVKFYETEVRPLYAPMLEMTRTGVLFDKAMQKKFCKVVQEQIVESKKVLYAIMDLPEVFNLNSDDQLRYVLFGQEPSTFSHLGGLATSKPGTKKYKELLSLQVIKDQCKPRYTLKNWIPSTTDGGVKYAVNDQSLLRFNIQLNNRLSDLRGQKQSVAVVQEQLDIDRVQKFLNELEHYVSLTKMLSTYGHYEPDADGKIYPRWIMHGTVSGRLACREPNLMNLVKEKDDPNDPGVMIRNFFVAPEGYKFISCDYVNLEAQLLAFETLDPILLEVFEKGLNLHDINTRSMFRIEPDHGFWKSARAAAKIFFFGGISYLGGDRGVYEKVYLKAPELKLTFANFCEKKNNWMSDHPAYSKWKDGIVEEVRTKRELRTEFGRYRAFMSNDSSIHREGVDFKIQSSGASLVNRAMVRIYHRKNVASPRSKFAFQIHDQLIMMVPDEDVTKMSLIMKSEMERKFQYKGITRSIPVELEVGQRFGEV